MLDLPEPSLFDSEEFSLVHDVSAAAEVVADDIAEVTSIFTFGGSKGLRLLKLSSNQGSFHTVQFNREGLSFVVARQQDRSTTKRGKTYNGVGKSLLIAILHFCLGSEMAEDWQNQLAEWEWTLEFEVGEALYCATRSVAKSKVINLDDDEMSVDSFKKWLQDQTMKLRQKVNNLTLRPFLKRFMRPSRDSYIEWRRVDKRETPFASLVVNSYLLGLDLPFVVRKNEIKKEKDNTNKQLATQKKDVVYQEYFGNPSTVDVQVRFYETKIAELKKNIDALNVAEDYYDIQRQANAIQRLLQEERNDLVIVRNQLENLRKSLEQHEDISVDKVNALYQEVNIHLPAQVSQRIEDVLRFHSQLMANRRERVEKEIARLVTRETELVHSVESKGRQMDEQLAYLGAHGALDEHVRLTQRLGGLQEKKDRLTKGREFHERTNKALRQLEKIAIQEEERTETYLSAPDLPYIKAIEVFSTLVRRFYPEKPCGLTVAINAGDNTIRFDIDAFIQDDPSDGINHVKIFCYDLTILQVRPDPGVDFVFHDSRIFDGVDSRYASILLETALEVTSRTGKQYIVALNENTIDGIREYWPEESVDFDEFIEKHKILELTDNSDEDRLLGRQVDISYDAK